ADAGPADRAPGARRARPRPAHVSHRVRGRGVAVGGPHRGRGRAPHRFPRRLTGTRARPAGRAQARLGAEIPAAEAISAPASRWLSIGAGGDAMADWTADYGTPQSQSPFEQPMPPMGGIGQPYETPGVTSASPFQPAAQSQEVRSPTGSGSYGYASQSTG